jgi:hypothetical protein
MISYAICVCNEVREIGSLLSFLEEVRDKSKSEIVVLLDSTKTKKDLLKCLKKFENIKVYSRDFDGDFSAHKNFLNSKCNGDFIFNIDADEIPQEALIKTLEGIEVNNAIELIMIPRINVCPGYTQAFLERWKFQVNDAGWINWPDYQGRFYRKGLSWVGKVHEKIAAQKVGILSEAPNPKLALWHVKDVKRQNSQNEFYLSALYK